MSTNAGSSDPRPQGKLSSDLYNLNSELLQRMLQDRQPHGAATEWPNKTPLVVPVARAELALFDLGLSQARGVEVLRAAAATAIPATIPSILRLADQLGYQLGDEATAPKALRTTVQAALIETMVRQFVQDGKLPDLKICHGYKTFPKSINDFYTVTSYHPADRFDPDERASTHRRPEKRRRLEIFIVRE